MLNSRAPSAAALGFGEGRTSVGPPGQTSSDTKGNEDDSPRPDAETKAMLRGDPFAGLGSYQAVMHFEWWKPVQPGDRVRKRRALVGVQEKRSDFGGSTAHETIAMGFANQQGEPIAIQRGTWIHAERDPDRERRVD